MSLTPHLFDDPKSLLKIGDLDVVAKMIVEGYMIGQHQSPFKGSSVEFVEHRQYYPGDEIRHIDWRAYGKTGHYFVKEYEEETNLRAHLLVDCSASMAFQRTTISKFDYAKQLAAAIAYLLIGQRDACGLITFSDVILDRCEPSANRVNFGQIIRFLQNRCPRQKSQLTRVLMEILPTLKRRSLIFLLTDCFDELEPFAAMLKQIRSARHELILMQITTPEEQDFPFNTPTQFRDLEQPDHSLLTSPHRLRQIYLARFQKFREELIKHCAAAGIEFLSLTTDRPDQKAIGEFLAFRERLKK